MCKDCLLTKFRMFWESSFMRKAAARGGLKNEEDEEVEVGEI